MASLSLSFGLSPFVSGAPAGRGARAEPRRFFSTKPFIYEVREIHSQQKLCFTYCYSAHPSVHHRSIQAYTHAASRALRAVETYVSLRPLTREEQRPTPSPKDGMPRAPCAIVPLQLERSSPAVTVSTGAGSFNTSMMAGDATSTTLAAHGHERCRIVLPCLMHAQRQLASAARRCCARRLPSASTRRGALRWVILR